MADAFFRVFEVIGEDLHAELHESELIRALAPMTRGWM